MAKYDAFLGAFFLPATALAAALTSGCGSTSSSSPPAANGGDDGGSGSSSGSPVMAGSGVSTGSSGAGSTGSTVDDASAAGSGSAIPSSGASSGASSGGSSGSASGAGSGSSSGASSGMSSGSAFGDAGAGATVDWTMPVPGAPPVTGGMTTGTVTVNRGTTTGHVGQGFAGLSFEKSHITNGSLTGRNAAMIGLFKLLGPSVVRLGADDVDHLSWSATAMPGAGTPPFPPVGTVDVDALADFLNATGWKTIYGVNFKTGVASNSAEEAKYAVTKLGSSLLGIEIGNEINLSGTWPGQKAKWESFAAAVLAGAPNVPIIGPDSAGSGVPTFLAPFAADEASKISILTAHYYRAQSGTGAATIANLSGPDAALVTRLSDVRTAMTANHIPAYRFDESNTFSHHGQDGVSNALISALWSVDFMFTNANNGASGVNFHGGQLGSDASLPTTPFFYAPIQEANNAVVAAAPLFYGMLLFTLAGNGNVLGTTVSSGGVNMTAYAIAASDGSTSVILDNKDTASAVTATVDLGGAIASAAAIYLQGPTPVSLGATSGITLAGAGITPAGTWAPKAPYALTASGNKVTVIVPPASAALVHAR